MDRKKNISIRKSEYFGKKKKMLNKGFNCWTACYLQVLVTSATFQLYVTYIYKLLSVAVFIGSMPFRSVGSASTEG